MTNIHQLIPDVQKLLRERRELEIPLTIKFGMPQEPPSLRLSKMGPICPRHLWYSIHHPELAEPFPPEAIFKFSYGHTIEAMALALAKAAGHSVLGEQDELVVDGIKGHRDCVLDGHIVDVKSCSSSMYQKFKDQQIMADDSFGYLDQLDGYMVGSAEDDLVTVKDVAFIWYIDKTIGKMGLYEHRLRETHIRSRVANHKRIVASSVPPKCQCGTIKDGESGNYRLDVKASYSPYKHICFPGLRTFLYRGRSGLEPRYLTKVVRTPDVPEVTLTRH